MKCSKNLFIHSCISLYFHLFDVDSIVNLVNLVCTYLLEGKESDARFYLELVHPAVRSSGQEGRLMSPTGRII